jgi:hypothetical protein
MNGEIPKEIADVIEAAYQWGFIRSSSEQVHRDANLRLMRAVHAPEFQRFMQDRACEKYMRETSSRQQMVSNPK